MDRFFTCCSRNSSGRGFDSSCIGTRRWRGRPHLRNQDYRNWRFVSVAHEEGNLRSLGAVLGNDVAIKACRGGKLPFPDGTIIAAMHYSHVPSEENDKIFGDSQSFVPGPPTNVQFMVKDSKKYASTGGWGYAHFDKDGKPGTEAALKTCAPCHAKASRDSIFTQYAPPPVAP
jgi:hypothetical protein